MPEVLGDLKVHGTVIEVPSITTKEGKTIGEQRVRVDFNPNNNDLVHEIKTKVAELINLAEQMKAEGKDARCASVAQTELESAAMWLVKAATS